MRPNNASLNSGVGEVSVSALSDRMVRRISARATTATRTVSVSALSDRMVRLGVFVGSTAIEDVSVSALSDRMVRHHCQFVCYGAWVSFSIRSFGSYGEARFGNVSIQYHLVFQYPLFRIVW